MAANAITRKQYACQNGLAKYGVTSTPDDSTWKEMGKNAHRICAAASIVP